MLSKRMEALTGLLTTKQEIFTALFQYTSINYNTIVLLQVCPNTLIDPQYKLLISHYILSFQIEY